MRRNRIMYCNDARHWYLFVHEPPMSLEKAWTPVDEVAGTGVDTFVYGVSRDDGLFYPSTVGRRFGADARGRLESSAYWRVWHNMQSLIDQGYDPLQILVDRAHQRGLEFVASLRMGALPGLPAEKSVSNGGLGLADEGVRDFQFRLLEELACEYPVEGVELDFAAAPGGTSWWFPPAEAPFLASGLTDFMRRVRERTQSRPGESCQVGARVYVTADLNERAGIEIERWLEDGLVDYVIPLFYGFSILDTNMPIEWLLSAASEHEVSVYPMLQPYYTDDSRMDQVCQSATAAMFRAAVITYRQLGADGFCTWALPWPLGDVERAILGELAETKPTGDQHYFLRRQCTRKPMAEWDYPSYLPRRLEVGQTYEINFMLGVDVGVWQDGGPRVTLQLGLTDLVADDSIKLELNGSCLSGERVNRRALRPITPYTGQWLDIDLAWTRPSIGRNCLEITVISRPTDLITPVILEDVEIIIEYSIFGGGYIGNDAQQMKSL